MNALTLIYNNIQLLADKAAISFRKDGEWKSLTWSEFGKELAKTINALKSIGVEKEDKVGIYSVNTKDWVLVDLATQMLGAISVPIYATNSEEQTEFILKQTEMKVVLVGENTQLNIIRRIKEKPEFHSVLVLSSVPLENPTEQEFYFPKWINAYEDIFDFKPVSIGGKLG